VIKSAFPRVAGLAILVACAWWSIHAYDDFNHVSPIHWGLMAPWAVLGLVPTLVGAAAGGLLIYRGRGGKTLLIAFFLTMVQAGAVAFLTADIRTSYEVTVKESRDSLEWTPAIQSEVE
jgi:hypothetical protein